MTNPRHKTEISRGRLIIGLLAALIVLAGIFTGLAMGFACLRNLWQEQCRVTNPDLDIVITTGKMVYPEAIIMRFGLTNGANLATIPLEELRRKFLATTPCVRELKIERRLPNRVTIDVLEREPVARLAGPRSRRETGRVVDFDGVVFECHKDVQLLPVIREKQTTTPPGSRLEGAAAAALRLVETLQLPELADLHVLEIDTARPDYLLLTLRGYSQAKIAWDHMLENSQSARESLRRQLNRLTQAIMSNLSPQTTLWTATDYGSPGRVYANDPTRTGR